MTNINNIGTQIPVEVAKGGTGISSATAYAILCGGTTSTAPIQSIAALGSVGDVLTSNGANNLPTFQAPAAGGGAVVQQVRTSVGGFQNLDVSFDFFANNIPQNTDGSEILTLAITPTDANHVLVIEAQINAVSLANELFLFRNSIADAKAAILVAQRQETNDQQRSGKLVFSETAGTTSPITYKLRAGGYSSTFGSAGLNGYFDGMAYSRVYGGVSSTAMRITEYTS